MSELGASKVVVREVEPVLRGVPSVATAVAGMVGLTERGPIGTPVRVASWEEYVATFGGFAPGLDVPHAALGFFQNGGQRLHVVRAAHYADADDVASVTAIAASGLLLALVTTPAEVVGTAVAPFALADGDELRVASGTATARAAARGVSATIATAPGPFLLADGMTVELVVNGGAPQVATFVDADFATITLATAAEVAAALGRQILGVTAQVQADGAVHIATIRRGTAASLTLVGGTALAALGVTATTVAGQGTVADLAAVTVAELDALLLADGGAVRADTSPAGTLRLRSREVGATASLRVEASTPGWLGLDTLAHTGASTSGAPVLVASASSPGTWGNRLSVVVRGGGATFDVLVWEGTRQREVFESLSVDPTSARFAPAVINHARTGSRFVRLALAPASAGLTIGAQTVALATGDDGTTGFGDLDLLGSPVGHTGLRALDAVAELALVCVPGRASAALYEGVLAYVETVRKGLVFAVLDPPAGLTADQIVALVSTLGLEGRSEHGALYWPRVRVANPAPAVLRDGDELVVPASGHVLGAYARTDIAMTGGVYQAPAGTTVGRLTGVLGAETEQVHDEAARDLIYPRRVNPIRGRYLDGARTLRGAGSFPSVGERRGASFIERSLALGLDQLRHRANTSELRAEVYRTVFQFLLAQMNVGAFASRDPRTAFYVDVSDVLNPPSVVFNNELRLRVGIATARPAEFIVLELSQDTRALEAELANAEG